MSPGTRSTRRDGCRCTRRNPRGQAKGRGKGAREARPKRRISLFSWGFFAFWPTEEQYPVQPAEEINHLIFLGYSHGEENTGKGEGNNLPIIHRMGKIISFPEKAKCLIYEKTKEKRRAVRPPSGRGTPLPSFLGSCGHPRQERLSHPGHPSPARKPGTRTEEAGENRMRSSTARRRRCSPPAARR